MGEHGGKFTISYIIEVHLLHGLLELGLVQRATAIIVHNPELPLESMKSSCSSLLELILHFRDQEAYCGIHGQTLIIAL